MSSPAKPETAAGVNEVPQIVPGGVVASTIMWHPGAVSATQGPRDDQK